MFSIVPSSPNFDENNWVIDIRRTIEEEHEDEPEAQVSIFSVPRGLMATAPQCYVPQLVAIGPFHYKDPELYETQRYKLAAAKRVQGKLLAARKFQLVVDKIAKQVSLIRACYHRPLGFNVETLSWMMAIDASFLLEFLQAISTRESSSVSSMMSHLIGVERRKPAYNSILRDVIMLENQIPLLVLRKILELQLESPECTDRLLQSMMARFCEEILPFRSLVDAWLSASESAHLLHFLYRMIIPEAEISGEMVTEPDERNGRYENGFLPRMWTVLKATFRHERWKRYSFKLLICLPWTIAGSIPIVSALKQPVEHILAALEQSAQERNQTEGGINALEVDKQPLMEEIAIPSVTELQRSGIRFSPTNGNVFSINFDSKTTTLHLPVVKLDVNSEVVLRNLVAFEATNASGPLVLARYTELMNGIIDTEDDAKLLRERGIILNHLKSDRDAASLWNGMSKSVRLTKVPFLDKVIEDVNRFHDGRWVVKARKYTNGKSISLLKFLVLLSLIFFFYFTRSI